MLIYFWIMFENNKIFVVVPAFNIGEPIVKFIASIPDFVDQIYLVDDNCPLKTGRILSENLPLNKKIASKWIQQSIKRTQWIWIK
mgnify:CR=1 FL=1